MTGIQSFYLLGWHMPALRTPFDRNAVATELIQMLLAPDAGRATVPVRIAGTDSHGRCQFGGGEGGPRSVGKTRGIDGGVAFGSRYMKALENVRVDNRTGEVA